MYSSKSSGRKRFSYFTIDMQEEAIHRHNLTNELRTALDNNQFQLFFQPIVDLVSGDINKAEALIRWNHPSRGMICPADFIPVAEEAGLIDAIGDWIFKESVRNVAKLRTDYNLAFQISVNKSPIQFLQQNSNAWIKYLSDFDVPGNCIAIEITEGILLNAEEHVTETLLNYRNHGIQIAIDDFGTGYSSLAYLKRFHIDYIKIDRTFVRSLGCDQSDNALCEAIIVMAHKLGFKVIAEGVESTVQRDILLDYNCDFAQGYLFSKPVPFDKFVDLLIHRHRHKNLANLRGKYY